MNVAELVNLIGFKLDKSSYNAVNDATVNIMNNMEKMAQKATAMFTLPIVALAGAAIKFYSVEKEAIAQVEQGLLSTQNASRKTLSELLRQAEDLQKETILGNETILRQATTQLLTFTNIAGEAFDRSQRAVLDVSAKLDPTMRNLQSVAIQLGKALNDPVANLSALSRSGIQFSEQQKEVIETLWKSNRILEAQDLILTEVEKQYGGTAKTLALNSTGTKQLTNALGDLLELFGKDLFPAFKRLTDWLTSTAYKLQDTLNPTLRKTILIFAGLLAIIGPVTLAIIGIAKAGLMVNAVLATMGLGIAKSNLGIAGTILKYGLLLGQFLLIAGALFLIFNDIYTYLTGGKSILGEILPAWKELGPKIYQALLPYIILILDLWESVKKYIVQYVNFIYNVVTGQSAKAAENFKNMLYALFDIATTLLAILLPIIWELIKGLFILLVKYIPTILMKIIDIIHTLIRSMLSGLWLIIDEWLTTVIDSIVQKIYDVAKKIPEIINNAIKGIGSFMGNIGANVKEYLAPGYSGNAVFGAPAFAGVPSNFVNNSSSVKKEITVKVNTDLKVPEGTPDLQKQYLKSTVENLFTDELNRLTRNLVQGLPEAE